MRLADRGHLQQLSRDDCLARLATSSLGRLGVTIQALPVIVPVNYTLDDRDHVIVRSAPGSKLDAATSGQVVAFEADEQADDGTWGWSVLVQAVAEEVDASERSRLRSLDLVANAFPGGEAYRYLRLDTSRISGREFARSASFRH